MEGIRLSEIGRLGDTMLNKGCFFVARPEVVILSLLVGITAVPMDGRAAAPAGVEDRSAAVHRRRRIILNDDAGTVLKVDFSTPEKFRNHRLVHTLNSNVDSIWYSLMVGSENYVYDCKVGQRIGSELYPGAETVKGDVDRHKQMAESMNALLAVGTDPLRETVRFAQEHDKEVFASFRMNMIQDSWRPSFVTRWKREHPEWCLGVREMTDSDRGKPHYMYWSALDYARSEVRDQRVEVIQDICTRYDVDGMELDFWRWPMLFKRSLDYQPVEQEEIQMMNNFLRRVRKEMGSIETQRQRPLLLAVRVFDTMEICLKMGLDVQTWLDQGLIDILVVGGTYNYYSVPTTQWVELAHEHDVPLYVCMYRAQSLERDRAHSAYHLSCGADGTYTFNVFGPEVVPTLRDVGDLDTLAGKNKHYVMNGTVGGVSFGHVVAPGTVPVGLKHDEWREAILLVGDDLQAETAGSGTARSTLSLALGGYSPDMDAVTVKLNGTQLDNSQWDEATVSFDVSAPPLVAGRNTIELRLEKGDTSAETGVDLKGVELRISFGQD